MIAFPILERLRVDGYGLYPGQNKNHHLDIEFGPGLTLILGANGLGKTTLITLLYRLLSGPSDLRMGSGESLGTVSLDAIDISNERRREFAQRVRDGAESASANLTFTLGRKRIVVIRSLRDLRLTSLEVDGMKIESADEQTYANVVCEGAGVYAFGDFLLLLRQLVFYFEDRRALVWDSTAQRQILRALFLDPEEAKQWSQLERKALSLDSDLRSTQWITKRQERETHKAEKIQSNASEIGVQIEALEKLQQTDTARQEFLGTRAAELDSVLSSCRLNLLRAEQLADSAQRNVERAQLSAIERAFPSVDESARYIFAQLIGDGHCRACGKQSQAAVERMQRNLAEKLCAVCDLPLPSGNIVSAGELATMRIENTREEAVKSQQQLHAAQRSYRETADEYTRIQSELAELSDKIGQRSQQLRALTNQLPPEEAKQRETQQGLELQRTRVEALRAQLAAAQKAYSEFVELRTRRLYNIAERVKEAFSNYAEGFLLEQITLSWAPERRRVGQFRDNPYIEFPAFSLDITGSDFSEPVRREGPEQVSESQREFVDLAFRMALIKVAVTDHAGTLVIDAPESSLDAVFVKRAARVLGRFARATDCNRLIVTSNISPGDLLPELVATAADDEHPPNLVNLFNLGIPTAALRMLENEYAEFRQELDKKIEERITNGASPL